MATSCRYENDTEEKLHLQAIQRLALDMGLPEEDIRILYEDILCGVREGARVRDYLVILVSRRVKDSIRSRGLTAGL